MANDDRVPDTELANYIRKLQDEVDERIVLLRALRENYDPEEIDHHEYIKTEAWQKQRQRVFRRDKFRCVLCGSATNLEVHHITYKRLGAEDISDLITLCDDCHETIHDQVNIIFAPSQFWELEKILYELENRDSPFHVTTPFVSWTVEDLVREATDLRAELLSINENIKDKFLSIDIRFMKCVGGT